MPVSCRDLASRCVDVVNRSMNARSDKWLPMVDKQKGIGSDIAFARQ